MHIATVIMATLFSLFSTIVMSYVSMATPIGPWIAPTLALFGLLIFKLFPIKQQTQSLVLAIASGSVGGIIATACGFSFPTLYFLDPSLFNIWMAQPSYFAAMLSGLSMSAGIFGIVIANILEERLIVDEKLAFPIGQLVYKTISVTDSISKSYELVRSFVGTIIFGIFQSGFGIFPSLIPTSVTLMSRMQIGVVTFPVIHFDIWPMLWAIGFITGHLIAIPLAVGTIAKIILVDPMHVVWFSYVSNMEFVLAFCSGMVLYGACMSFLGLPKMIKQGAAWMHANGMQGSSSSDIRSLSAMEWVVCAVVVISFLSYVGFSFLSQAYIVLATFACAYQIAVIAGKIGLAPLGRFATFVMVPAMLLFQIDFIQIVFVATFVEITGGVVADILFGRKMARMADIKRSTICWYQYFGLLVSSLAIGGIFWLMITHFKLGSPQLFAYKAQSRQLLISAKQFDYYALIIGAAFSCILQHLRINSMLVLGGLLMPINISLGLVFGGILTFFVADREAWEPWWSGVFTANSLWMLISRLLG